MSAVMAPVLRAPWLAPLRARWRSIAARDRRLVAVAGAIVAALVLWLVALQPAWRTLRDAPAQIEALDSQLQQMRLLASEAGELRAAPALSAQQSAQALKAASERLGPRARLALQGDRAVLTLAGVGSAELRDWLAEARAGARARPVEAQLSRTAQGFSGSIVLAIGAGR